MCGGAKVLNNHKSVLKAVQILGIRKYYSKNFKNLYCSESAPREENFRAANTYILNIFK